MLVGELATGKHPTQREGVTSSTNCGKRSDGRRTLKAITVSEELAHGLIRDCRQG